MFIVLFAILAHLCNADQCHSHGTCITHGSGLGTPGAVLLQKTLSKHGVASDDDNTLAVPRIFVAIMTARSAKPEQRMAARRAWTAADGGSGNLCYRFAVCHRSGDSDGFLQVLQAEQKKHSDILFLDCEEGYGRGLLTRKLIEVMGAYKNASKSSDKCLDRELFMKTDDDTFVNSAVFRQSLAEAIVENKTDSVYAGAWREGWPVRDPQAKFYEPMETWPEDVFLPSMLGGPGYILGRRLVQQILDQQIAEKYILYNEDKAVGVWINMLEKQDVKVSWISLQVFEGLEVHSEIAKSAWESLRNAKWSDYSYALHHHLSAGNIDCFLEMQAKSEPNAEVRSCLPS